MAPSFAPGEPHESPKPEPIGNMPMIILFTTCTLCVLFILWRRADTLRRVVSHQLKTLSRREGAIRLSQDDGPPSNVFIADDYDDDNEQLQDSDDEPLSQHIREATNAWKQPTAEERAREETIKVLPSKPNQPPP